jgi:OHCU decarboxylase
MSALISNPYLTVGERIEIRLTALNDCAPETAYVQFQRCCGSSKWAEQMTQLRPFLTLEQIESAANQVWARCSKQDWREALAAHLRIGQQCNSRWSKDEQSGFNRASPLLQDEFARTSRRYEAKFGYIFIICATGKTLREMLVNMKHRLGNDAEMELHIAAEQQRLITILRLKKLLSE